MAYGLTEMLFAAQQLVADLVARPVLVGASARDAVRLGAIARAHDHRRAWWTRAF